MRIRVDGAGVSGQMTTGRLQPRFGIGFSWVFKDWQFSNAYRKMRCGDRD